jgi:PEP-CTERM motif
MNFKSLSVGITLAIGSALAMTGAAQAASLINFDTKVSYPGTPNPCVANAINAQCDIKLESVKLAGQTLSAGQLYKVTDAALIKNKPITYHTSAIDGGLSVDKGDLANGVAINNLVVEAGVAAAQFNTSADEQAIAKSLGGSTPIFNMNQIVDGEDNGYFTLDLLFDAGKAFNTLLLWERGMNSDIEVQAITAVSGNQATTFGETQLVSRNDWKSAQYSIDTTEIAGAQPVGSKGVVFSKDVLGVRLVSKSSFNGPDLKVAATKVPEPATVASLGLVAGVAAWSRRKRQA